MPGTVLGRLDRVGKKAKPDRLLSQAPSLTHARIPKCPTRALPTNPSQKTSVNEWVCPPVQMRPLPPRPVWQTPPKAPALKAHASWHVRPFLLCAPNSCTASKALSNAISFVKPSSNLLKLSQSLITLYWNDCVQVDVLHQTGIPSPGATQE